MKKTRDNREVLGIKRRELAAHDEDWPKIKALADRLSAEVQPVEAAGFDGDMLEAQAFAYLAVRVARGLPTSAPGTTGVAAAVGGGRVSRPGD